MNSSSIRPEGLRAPRQRLLAGKRHNHHLQEGERHHTHPPPPPPPYAQATNDGSPAAATAVPRYMTGVRPLAQSRTANKGTNTNSCDSHGNSGERRNITAFDIGRADVFDLSLGTNHNHGGGGGDLSLQQRSSLRAAQRNGRYHLGSIRSGGGGGGGFVGEGPTVVGEGEGEGYSPEGGGVVDKYSFRAPSDRRPQRHLLLTDKGPRNVEAVFQLEHDDPLHPLEARGAGCRNGLVARQKLAAAAVQCCCCEAGPCDCHAHDCVWVEVEKGEADSVSEAGVCCEGCSPCANNDADADADADVNVWTVTDSSSFSSLSHTPPSASSQSSTPPPPPPAAAAAAEERNAYHASLPGAAGRGDVGGASSGGLSSPPTPRHQRQAPMVIDETIFTNGNGGSTDDGGSNSNDGGDGQFIDFHRSGLRFPGCDRGAAALARREAEWITGFVPAARPYDVTPSAGRCGQRQHYRTTFGVVQPPPESAMYMSEADRFRRQR